MNVLASFPPSTFFCPYEPAVKSCLLASKPTGFLLKSFGPSVYFIIALSVPFRITPPAMALVTHVLDKAGSTLLNLKPKRSINEYENFFHFVTSPS